MSEEKTIPSLTLDPAPTEAAVANIKEPMPPMPAGAPGMM